jgi:hypothetical protein
MDRPKGRIGSLWQFGSKRRPRKLADGASATTRLTASSEPERHSGSSGRALTRLDSRAMKLAAQTAVGAGGRLEAGSDDQQEWAKIRAAGNGGYAEARGRRSW